MLIEFFLVSFIFVISFFIIFKLWLFYDHEKPLFDEIILRINLAKNSNKKEFTYFFNQDGYYTYPNKSNKFYKNFSKYYKGTKKDNLAINLHIDKRNYLQSIDVKILENDEQINKIELKEIIYDL